MKAALALMALAILASGCGRPAAPAAPSSVATFEDGRAMAKVTGLGQDYGNLYTEFVQADLTRLGIEPGSEFLAGKAGSEEVFTVLLGRKYSDVPRGGWVAMLSEEGVLKIARNLENAAVAMGCGPGDQVFIAPKPLPGQ